MCHRRPVTDAPATSLIKTVEDALPMVRDIEPPLRPADTP